MNSWFKSKINRFLRLILLTFLSFILTITWIPIARGQLPFFDINPISRKDIINIFNRPYTCGNFVCSQLWFHGFPIYEVASYPINQQKLESSIPVEERAKRIQNNLRKVLQITLANNGINSHSLSLEKYFFQLNRIKQETIKLENNQIPQSFETDGTNQEIKTVIHPNTPKIKVGTFNGETVIYFPKQFGSPRQIIATVTIADAKNQSKTIEKIAQDWKDIILSVISLALHERDFYASNSLVKPIIIIFLIVVIILLNFGLVFLQINCKKYYRDIRNKLQNLDEYLILVTKFANTKELVTMLPKQNLKVNLTNLSNGKKVEIFAVYLLAIEGIYQPISLLIQEDLISNNRKKNISLKSAIANKLLLNIFLKLLWQTMPKVFLLKQKSLKQELNIVIFITRLLQWVQGLIWLWGIGFILFFYPQTRAISFLLIEGPIQILLIWVFVSLADKVGDFVIESFLHDWAENAQMVNPNSGRYSLRVPTYSAALTNMTSVVFWIIGIVATAEILGISTQVLASAGIVAAVGAYFSQNFIKDVINGMLILWNDRYAVGDWVSIGTDVGEVEKINLYMTGLRNSDGELITIPHSTITTVKNLTKNWARVNFTIEIAYNADIKKAMQIIQAVARTMQSEVEWQDSFIEPATVLGVDRVSHSGIIIRVWITTPALQQWSVGREFRLRVKEAFDLKGIGIGVPQRSLSVQNLSEFSNEKQNGKYNPEDLSIN